MSAPAPAPGAPEALAPTYAMPPMVFVRGQGAYLEDEGGQAYLDMTAGVGVNALGHGHPALRAALHEAADGLIHTSNLFRTRPAARLAEALVEGSFADRVFFCNSGAEAVEATMKFARLARPGRPGLVAFRGGFHGRTFGALAATDRPGYQRPFTPLAGGVRILEPDDQALASIGDGDAAVIVEPIQCEGGLRSFPEGWLQALRRRCDQVGALLIFDEVQTGLGRTGRLWGYQHVGVRPDLVAVAKPLGGGLPMGAALVTEEVAGAMFPGCHATTFGGGPLVARVGLAALDVVRAPGFLDGVLERGRHLAAALSGLAAAHDGEVRGCGLLRGLRLPGRAAKVVEAARDEHLLVAPAGDDVVRIYPPLDARVEDLDEAVRRLDLAIRRVPLEASRE